MCFQLEVAEARLKSVSAIKDDAERCIYWVFAMLGTWNLLGVCYVWNRN